MTNEEMLKELKESIEGCGFQCHIETYQAAISAMEKQIPKKPVIKEFNDLPNGVIEKVAYCPNCDYSQGEIEPYVCSFICMQKFEKYGSIYSDASKNIGHCIACGQALNWGDVE